MAKFLCHCWLSALILGVTVLCLAASATVSATRTLARNGTLKRRRVPLRSESSAECSRQATLMPAATRTDGRSYEIALSHSTPTVKSASSKTRS